MLNRISQLVTDACAAAKTSPTHDYLVAADALQALEVARSLPRDFGARCLALRDALHYAQTLVRRALLSLPSHPGLQELRDGIAEALLVLDYRRANPTKRAERLTYLYRNGSRTAQLACVACGQRSPTWCSNWPRTVVVQTWEQEHYARHLGE